jgi:hypothetical protein
MAFTPLWKRLNWIAQLRPPASGPVSREYRLWLQGFLRERIHLTIWVAMALLVIFITLNMALVVPAISEGGEEAIGLTAEQYRLYPIFFVSQQLGLLLNGFLLRRAISLERLRWHFFGFGVAVILLPQFVYMAVGETTMDLGG